MRIEEARDTLKRAGFEDGSGHRKASVMQPVDDDRFWIGDVVVSPLEDSKYIVIYVNEGPWMKGVGHGPGEDYRPPTDAEFRYFLKAGLHLREVRP